MSAKQNLVQRPLPPAVRPGATPGVASSNSNAGKIAEISKQLNKASGMQAVRLAAQLTSLRRR